ncbi:hypothetical protein PoB_006741600 [Plakobranchus ocellatus]|uniref:Uncharacterized protein n=1 Tax=Plakobranchus ocellatus TaxID=259542 RepID=A0AAV4DA19_9GAST|nr:hypothetical protein PoB_006741600 [Plakobranchus ocellatus]
MPLRTLRGSARGRGQSNKQARRRRGGSQQQLSLYPCCCGETKEKRSIACLVLQHKVISVYPPDNGPCDETVRILTTEFGSFQHELPLSILWMGPKKGKGKVWLPNHFLPIAPESSDDAAAHDDEKQTDDSVCGGCDDDVLNNDGNVYEVDTGGDDGHADNDNNEIAII